MQEKNGLAKDAHIQGRRGTSVHEKDVEELQYMIFRDWYQLQNTS